MSDWPDFIDSFMAYTDAISTPSMFRKWTAISMLGAALERRVSAATGQGSLYPNFFILLIAPSGGGKGIIKEARNMMRTIYEPGSKARAFHIGSNNITPASILDELAKAKCSRFTSDGPMLVYHSLYFVAEEFQNWLPAWDTALIGKLNEIWNNNPSYEESRRTGTVKELNIENPQLNLLGGAQPAYFASTFPEESWNTGLGRRTIMVYGADMPWRSVWYQVDENETLRAQLERQLAQASQIAWQMKWHPEAAQRIDDWQFSGEPHKGGAPVPKHSKLQAYCANRLVNVVKLAIIMAISRSCGREIALCDVDRAIDATIEAEALMPDIFRAMTGKSDAAVIEETHRFVHGVYYKSKLVNGGTRPGVSPDSVRRFMLGRVPHDKVDGLLMQMERANILARDNGGLFIPKPKAEHEQE